MRKPLVCFAAMAACAVSQAVVGTTSKTTDTPVDSFWQWVGQIKGNASAVAIGPRTILTAKHNGNPFNKFVLGGNEYTIIEKFDAPAIDGFQNDVTLYNLATDLPGYYDIGPAPSVGNVATVVGFGDSGKVNAAGTGYFLDVQAGQRHAATNTIDDISTQFGQNYLTTFLIAAPDAQVAAGDSGGGFFVNGKLVGVISGKLTDNSPGADLLFATNGTVHYGSAAVNITTPKFRQFITDHAYSAVPEPSTYAMLGVGLLAFARRRRTRG